MYLMAAIGCWIGWILFVVGLLSVNPATMVVGGVIAYSGYSVLKGAKRD